MTDKPATRRELAAAITYVMEQARKSTAPTLPDTAGEAVLNLIEQSGLRIVEWPPTDLVLRDALTAALVARRLA